MSDRSVFRLKSQVPANRVPRCKGALIELRNENYQLCLGVKLPKAAMACVPKCVPVGVGFRVSVGLAYLHMCVGSDEA